MTDKTRIFENSLNVERISRDMIAALFPPRKKYLNKGDFGCALVVGGSASYVGAPLFSAESAAKTLAALAEAGMRAGAGTSTLCVPDFMVQSLYGQVKFSAIKGLSSLDGNIVFLEEEFKKILPKKGAILIGNGMADGQAFEMVQYLLDNTTFNFVLDADGLKRANEIATYESRAVLTPHIGEFSRMSGLSVDEINENPARVCCDYAIKKHCVLVLKSNVTYISDGEKVYKNTTGNVKLAKGGSGDILGGIICGLLAFGINPLDAACAGTYLLGRCAELSNVNEYSNMPTDTLRVLPAAIDEVIKARK